MTNDTQNQDKFGFGEIFENNQDPKIREKWNAAKKFEEMFKDLQEGK